ncbi:chemotaxis protein CheV [Hyalangium gracile]|uniref:chemotaxis protein CheV n=1 Tax=Hyalangium gracile TaxID=394092 RepID=UPI001CCD5393|nr:chemotaxis protein CheV [Hyalangium gracile]
MKLLPLHDEVPEEARAELEERAALLRRPPEVADLGTTPVLVVRAGEHRLGLPLSGVESVCSAAPESLTAGLLELREERLPVVDLCSRLNVLPGNTSDELRVVILLARGRRLALSLTARAPHRTVLEAGGFRVHTSASGAQALQLLSWATFDLVVADVSMTEMSDHAFTARLRAQPSTRAMPVLLVSAQDTLAEQEAGLEAGADAFLSKRECRAGRLLDAVEELLARPWVRA